MNSKKLLPVLVIALLALGVGGYFMFLHQPADKTPVVTADDDEPGKPSKPRPQPRPAGNNPGGHAGNPRSEPEPERRPPALTGMKAASGAVSGRVFDTTGGIPGATVVLLDATDLSKRIAETEAQSDGEEKDLGRYAFENVAFTGQAFVAVLSEGWSIACSADLEMTGNSAFTGIDIEVTDETSFVAKVVDADNNGAPIEGAVITLRGDKRLGQLLALAAGGKAHTTNPQGEAAIKQLPAGDFTFDASKQGYFAFAWNQQTVSTATVSMKPRESREFTFKLSRAGACHGRIMGKTSPGSPTEAGTLAPVAGATVELGWEFGGYIATTATDADGKFRFDTVPAAAPGNQTQPRVTVRGSMTGYGTQKRDFRVSPGEDKDLGDIALDDGFNVGGIVIDKQSNPIAGAEVYVDEPGNNWQSGGTLVAGVVQPKRIFSTTSGADGRFQLDGLPMRDANKGMTINAKAKGYGTGSAPLTPAAGVELQVTITLAEAGSIAGIVVDQGGRPIAAAKVGALLTNDEAGKSTVGGEAQMFFRSLFGRETSDSGAEPFTANVATGQDGRFVLPDLAAGKYVVMAVHNEYAPGIHAGVEVRSGAVTELRFELKSGGEIYGTYFNALGQPTGGATITAFVMATDMSLVRSAVTDSGGRFSIKGLPGNTYGVKPIAGMDFGRMFQLSTNERVTVDFGQRVEHNVYERIPGTARIYGRVTLDGLPYTGGFTISGGGFGGAAVRTGRCDDQGNYSVENLPLGSHNMILASIGQNESRNSRNSAAGIMQQKMIRVATTPEERIDVEFQSVSISGVISITGGGPLPEDVVVFASRVVEREEQQRGQDSIWEQLQTQLIEQKKPKPDTGEFSITGLAPGVYTVTARGKTSGFVTVGPFKLVQPLGGVKIELSGATAKIKARVLNYVSPEQGEAGTASATSFLRDTGTLVVEDLDGNQINLGSLRAGDADGGGGGVPDNWVRLRAEEGSPGVFGFEREGLPVGVFNLTLQVNNYAPVTLRRVQLEPDTQAQLEFVLAPAGDLEVQITNQDLDPEAARNLRFTILDSTGKPYVKRFTLMDFLQNMLNPPDPSKQNTFVLSDFPPDSYSMTFNLPGYKPATRVFVIASNQVTHIDVTFEAEGTPAPGGG